MNDSTFGPHHIFPAILLSAALALPAWAQLRVSKIVPDTTLHDGDVNVFTYTSLGMTVVSVPKTFEYVYISEDPESVRVIGERRGYRYLVNASFFDGDRLHATHAGWLRIGGRVLAPLKRDRQLTHVVRYEAGVRKVRYTPYGEFSPPADTSALEFQTGPMIIENGRVAAKYIRESINGLGAYPRTLLATIDRRRVFLIVVRRPVALDTLAGSLLRLSLFRKGRFDVVNLDGGSSVALYSSAHPRLCYNDGARLPLLLGIR
jgi:hypothetical protein